jgi:hypothetical protein
VADHPAATRQDAHLKIAVAGGDATHEDALASMKGRWKHPISGTGWYQKVNEVLPPSQG